MGENCETRLTTTTTTTTSTTTTSTTTSTTTPTTATSTRTTQPMTTSRPVTKSETPHTSSSQITSTRPPVQSTDTIGTTAVTSTTARVVLTTEPIPVDFTWSTSVPLTSEPPSQNNNTTSYQTVSSAILPTPPIVSSPLPQTSTVETTDHVPSPLITTVSVTSTSKYVQKPPKSFKVFQLRLNRQPFRLKPSSNYAKTFIARKVFAMGRAVPCRTSMNGTILVFLQASQSSLIVLQDKRCVVTILFHVSKKATGARR